MQSKLTINETEYIKSILPIREESSHKGNFGKLLIMAGSKGMCGAAVLASRAAFRAGAGLVKVSVPEELFNIIQIANPEAICTRRLPFKMDYSEYDGIAIGPGMGNTEETFSYVKSILEKFNGPVVIDADALNAIAQHRACELIKNSACRSIITPHPGEAARLLELSTTDFSKIPRTEAAQMLSDRTGSVTVLKGAGTVVADPRGKIYINKTGNPGMATAGSGDVLTGILSALIVQKIDLYKAALAGVFIHGLAGDLAADEFGMTGMTAGDIIQFIAYAFKKIENKPNHTI